MVSWRLLRWPVSLLNADGVYGRRPFRREPDVFAGRRADESENRGADRIGHVKLDRRTRANELFATQALRHEGLAVVQRRRDGVDDLVGDDASQRNAQVSSGDQGKADGG